MRRIVTCNAFSLLLSPERESMASCYTRAIDPPARGGERMFSGGGYGTGREAIKEALTIHTHRIER